MGCVFSCECNSKIPRDSLLGLVFKNWHDLTSGKLLLFKYRLIRLSEKMWQTYELDNNETWPEFGSLNEKLLSSLISCIHKDKYFNELENARLSMVLSCQQSPSANKTEKYILL